MKYRITHRTTYTYDYPVSVGNHVACLHPRSFAGNSLLATQLTVSPTPSDLTHRHDYFGNTLSFFTVQQPHTELIGRSPQRGRGRRRPAGRISSTPPWEAAAASLAAAQTREGLDAYQYQFDSPRIQRPAGVRRLCA